MKKMEKILKALANSRRLAILKFLKKNKEASVNDISETIKLSFKATSKHLAILFQSNILEREQKSFYGMYRLKEQQNPITTYIISRLK